MNKKIAQFLLIIITFLLLYFVIFISGDKYKYEDLFINETKWNNIIESKKYNNDLKITNIKFNNYDLFLSNNTWYYSIIEKSSNAYNPIITYKTDKSSKVYILENKITEKSIENNEKIKLIVYNDSEYNIYNIICTTLPILNINYDSNKILEKDNDIKMDMYLFDNRYNASQRTILSEGLIQLRGNTSLVYPKVGYKLSLTKESLGDNKRNNNISLLGMRQDDDWILYSGYNDQEKIRNVFSSKLWYDSCASNNNFGIKNGTEYKYVELFFNNEYWGLYALGMPIDEKTIDLQKDVNQNYDEYLFKKVTWERSEINILSNPSNTLAGYNLVNSDDNKAWDLLTNYYKTLITTQDNESLYHINDINNAIDAYLFLNFVQGTDNTRDDSIRNCFISFKKYNNQYIALYTPWDLDITFGNLWYLYNKNLTTEYGNSVDSNTIIQLNTVYYLIQLNDLNITTLLKERYNELRNTYWNNEYIYDILDNYESNIYYSGAFLRDMERWPDGNYNKPEDKLTNFKNYISERLKYMDIYIDNLN